MHFDLAGLPDDVSIEEAVLSLHAIDGGGDTLVYAMPATSGWSENESSAPACASGDESSAEAVGDEWKWDATALVRNQHAGEAKTFGFCLILRDEDDAVTFGSRESADAAPSLTLTYTTYRGHTSDFQLQNSGLRPLTSDLLPRTL